MTAAAVAAMVQGGMKGCAGRLHWSSDVWGWCKLKQNMVSMVHTVSHMRMVQVGAEQRCTSYRRRRYEDAYVGTTQHACNGTWRGRAAGLRLGGTGTAVA